MDSKVTDFGGYSVKSVKSFNGMEDAGYNCDLYKGKVKVAECIYEGSGGMVLVYWKDSWRMGDKETGKVEISGINSQGNSYSYQVSPEEKLFHDFLKSLPRLKSEYFEDGLEVDTDIFIGEMVGAIEMRQMVQKDLRKEYIYKLNDNKLYVIKKKIKGQKVTLEVIKKHLFDKYGAGNFLLLNDEPIEVAIKCLAPM